MVEKEGLSAEARDHYRRLKEAHISTLCAASQAYDKAVLGLSTAVIGFTFAFMQFDDVHKTYVWRCLLITTWGLLVFSLICLLSSFVADQWLSAKRIERYGKASDEGAMAEIKDEKEKFVMEWAPIAAGVSFISGIIFFIIFAWFNSPKMWG